LLFYFDCNLFFQVFDAELAASAQDSNRFLVQFDVPISASTPHIYISALTFSPAECFVAKHYRSRFSNLLSVLSGADQNWPPLLNIFRGHTDTVYSAVFSPDGKHVVSGSVDDTVRIWDAGTGELVAGPFEGHTGPVCSVAVSPDGKHVVSGSDDCTIRIWDAKDGDVVGGPFEGHTGYVESVAYSPDGKCIVSGSNDHTICIWDAGTGELLAGPFEGHTGCVECVAFSPNGKCVISSSSDHTIRIWDAETGGLELCHLKGKAGIVLCVAFSPDGKNVASGFYEAIQIWDAVTGELVGGPFTGHSEYVESLSYSPDGKYVASGSQDRTIRIWNVGTGELVAGPFTGHTERVWSVNYSPDGKRLVSGSADHTIRIWDTEISLTVSGPSDGPSTPIPCLTFSQDSLGAGSHHDYHQMISCDRDTKTPQVVAFHGCPEVVLSVTPSSLDGHLGSVFCDVTLRNSTKGCFNTPAGYLSQQSLIDGWVRCSNLVDRDSGDSRLLFWVPETCREALCGAETLIVAGKRTTRLDLSRFAHGVSWTECHSSVSTLNNLAELHPLKIALLYFVAAIMSSRK
jgi:WD40 repeat protein